MPFKIGDRVRVIHNTGIYHCAQVGAEGLVISWSPSTKSYGVQFQAAGWAWQPGQGKPGGSQFISAEDLALATPPKVAKTVSLPPLETRLLSEFRTQGSRGLSAMDAMRALGVGGASFTKRISVLRKAGLNIARKVHKDPFTGRKYGRYILVETV